MRCMRQRLAAALAGTVAVVSSMTAANAAAATAAKPSGATTVRGVVVAREGARGTLVVASAGGRVETLRTRDARRVGTRIIARAARLADGTYRAASVRAHGSARRARVHGVVVLSNRGRLVLSAGGSVFALPQGRSLSGVGGGDDVQPGDVVEATVEIDPQTGSVETGTVEQVGRASLVELEGTIASLSATTLVLAVEHGAITTISIPSSLSLPASIVTGDRVEVLAQFADGAFTLVTIQDDHAAARSGSGASSEDERGEVEAEGIVSAVSAGSLTVQTEHGSAVTLVVPAGFDVSSVKVGDRVHAKGELQGDGSIVLRRLKLQGAQHGPEHSDRIEVEGAVSALVPGSITIQPDHGSPVTFAVPSDLDLSGVAVGDRVEAKGMRNPDGSLTLARLEAKEEAKSADDQSSGSGDDEPVGSGDD